MWFKKDSLCFPFIKDAPAYCPLSDDAADESPYVTRQSVWSGFTGFTSVHGVPVIVSSRGFFKKAVWIAAFLAAIGLMIFQIYNITLTYISNPVIPVIVNERSRYLNFPAVTVCNTNPIKSSALKTSESISTLVDSWGNEKKRKKRSSSQDKPNDEGHRVTRYVTNHNTMVSSQNIHGTANGNAQDFDTHDGSSNGELIWKETHHGQPAVEVPLPPLMDEEDEVPDKTTRNDIVWWNVLEKHQPIRSANKPTERDIVKDTDDMQDVENRTHTEWQGNSPGKNARQHAPRSVEAALKRYKRGGGFETICEEILPYGDMCLVNENTLTCSDGAATCAGLTGDYRVGCLETKTKWQAVTTSSLFSNTSALEKNEYMIGLTSAVAGNYTWTSGVTHSYANWGPGAAYENTFDCAVGNWMSSHQWELENSNKRVLILCEATDVVPPVPDTTTTTTTETTTTPTTTTETTTQTTTPTTTTGITTATTTTGTTSTETTTPTTTETTYTQTTTPASTTETTTPDTTTETTSTEITTGEATPTVFQSSFPDREPPREDFQQENDVLQALAELPVDVKKGLGYKLDEFMLSCQYDGVACTLSEFGEFFDAVHGNCYVYNAGWVTEEIKISQQPGRSQGLKIMLNLGQEEYVQGVAQSAGAVVVVHNQGKMPFPEDEGVFAHPGHLTSIGITMAEIDRLGGKYSNCTYDNKLPDINVYEEHYPVNYSVNACYKTCYQRNVITTCSCSDPQYPDSGAALGSHQVPVCDARDTIQDDCVYGVLLDFIQDKLECDCPIPCSEKTFTYSLSRSQWPSENYEDDLISLVEEQVPSFANSTDKSEQVKRNLVLLEVYFRHFNYRYIYEKPKYPFTLYMADFASNIGLFLGMSLFTIGEVLELGVDMLALFCCRQIRKLERPSQSRQRTHSDASSSEVPRKPSQEFLINPNDWVRTRSLSHQSFDQANVASLHTSPKDEHSSSHHQSSNDRHDQQDLSAATSRKKCRRVGTVIGPAIEGLELASRTQPNQKNRGTLSPSNIETQWATRTKNGSPGTMRGPRKISSTSTSSSGSTSEYKNMLHSGREKDERKVSDISYIIEEETHLTYFVS